MGPVPGIPRPRVRQIRSAVGSQPSAALVRLAWVGVAGGPGLLDFAMFGHPITGVDVPITREHRA